LSIQTKKFITLFREISKINLDKTMDHMDHINIMKQKQEQILHTVEKFTKYFNFNYENLKSEEKEATGEKGLKFHGCFLELSNFLGNRSRPSSVRKVKNALQAN